MLESLRQYDWRGGLIQSAAFLCGSYAVSTYASRRLEEMNHKILANKVARNNLRRRFQSTHDDVCFTIMALIPTLAFQILEDMDVDSLTNELQSVSRASRSRTLRPSQDRPRSPSVSEMSSLSDARSDPGSLSHSVSGFDTDRVSVASSSWMEPMSAPGVPTAPQDIPAQLSDSITSTSSSLSQNTENSVATGSSRTKRQLWDEIKVLALTRTLTTLYTTTLLSLLTVVQLNILGRSRYVESVRTADRADRARDQIPDFSLTGILAREAIASIVDVEAKWPTWIFGQDNIDEEDDALDAIPDETELRFLTLSWWVLHVGWKDVAARVRSSVESVFDDVSLKAKLSPSELFTLIMDVRRRVEMDRTGSQVGTRFLSCLLPPTPETTAHVLTQGGALPIPREGELHNRIDRLLAKGPTYNQNSSSTHSNVTEPSVSVTDRPRDGLSRATAIPIESPAPRAVGFSTSPFSHTRKTDHSSRVSQSPSDSSLHCPQPAFSLGVSNSVITSRTTVDVDPQFNALLAETRRYVSGPDFAYALCCALDRATEVLMDGLRLRVFVDTASAVNVPNAEEPQAQPKTGDSEAGTSSETKEETAKVRLAGMLPGLARWSQLALNSTPNELVDNIMAVREVNALEAIIISDYQDRFPAIS